MSDDIMAKIKTKDGEVLTATIWSAGQVSRNGRIYSADVMQKALTNSKLPSISIHSNAYPGLDMVAADLATLVLPFTKEDLQYI